MLIQKTCSCGIVLLTKTRCKKISSKTKKDSCFWQQLVQVNFCSTLRLAREFVKDICSRRMDEQSVLLPCKAVEDVNSEVVITHDPDWDSAVSCLALFLCRLRHLLPRCLLTLNLAHLTQPLLSSSSSQTP